MHSPYFLPATDPAHLPARSQGYCDGRGRGHDLQRWPVPWRRVGWINLSRTHPGDHEVIISLGELVEPIEFIDIFDGEGDHEEEDEDHSLDPHFWLDPLRAQSAVNEIAARLSAIDSDSAEYYQSGAEQYNQELSDLHSWIQDRVATIPEDDRLLVTSHDSFQYFAQRYGFEVVGAIFPTTTEAEPTAQELANLVETIEDKGARALFR